MEYLVFAFRSRAHTVKFSSYLRSNGIRNEIINTPKEAGVGCGLSVKLSVNQLNVAKRAVAMTGLDSFAGIFRVKLLGGKRFVRTI